MKLEATEIAETPIEFETVTSTWPVPAGVTAVSSVGETSVTEVAATFPKRTVESGVKSLPEIDTEVPPDVGPDCGDKEVTDGGVPKFNSVVEPHPLRDAVRELL